MNNNHLWAVTVDGVTSTTPDPAATVALLVGALRHHAPNRWMNWRIDRDGSAVVIGTVDAAPIEPGTEYDDWAAFWADGIRQQLGADPDGAS